MELFVFLSKGLALLIFFYIVVLLLGEFFPWGDGEDE